MLNIYYLLNSAQLCIKGLEKELFSKEFQADSSDESLPVLEFRFKDYDELFVSHYGIKYPQDQSDFDAWFSSDSKEHTILGAKRGEWDKFVLYADHQMSLFINELILVGFYSYMALRETLLMHASAVSYKGESVVFTAPSGTGKTTQAKLWAEFKNAEILNGDKVFLKQESDGIHAWGSPWKGSSPYALNESAKVKGIVVLRQAKENTIRRLNVLEAMELFVPHVFFPKWDEACEKAVFGFLDIVMSEIPIYLLSCRPDEEAVNMTYSALWEDR